MRTVSVVPYLRVACKYVETVETEEKENESEI